MAEAVWNEWRRKNPHEDVDLSRAYLRDATLWEANLRGADLSGADLERADLRQADLREADLQRADLSHADLFEASLQKANLCEARLSVARLRRADLAEAELGGTDLKSADLFGNNLHKAYFRESIFGWTNFGYLDLSQALGLETAQHKGPSSLGVDTIYKSKGMIPEVFLRGVGLDEDFIHYTSPLLGRAIEFYSCFISYSEPDESFARRLHDQLQARGIRCWLDEHQILPGDDIREAIDQGIRLWDKLLLCASEESLQSWWVDQEIEKGLQKEEDFSKDRGVKVKVIIPLSLDGFLLSRKYTGPNKSFLRRRRAADFAGWETDNAKFEAEFDKVVKALRADEGARERPPESRL